MASVRQARVEDFGVVSGFEAPRRLSQATRRLAARALAGEWGRAMVRADEAFPLTEADLAGLSPMRHYARAVRRIAERAPLRHETDELLAGAATLVEATWHRAPLTPFGSVSHTTIGFDRGMRIGYAGLRRQIDERLARGDLDARGTELLEAMRDCLDAAGAWHGRYVALLEQRVAEATGAQREHAQAVLDALRPVPENPPQNFRQALQSLWMMWDFQRLCGNWSGLGRLDAMLGPYLQADLSAGRITLDEARELIAHFWIKGCEWIGQDSQNGTGDAQFYQNVVLGGIDAEGCDVTNEVTYLILDVVEELHISDFPIAVRVSPGTPERLLRRIAEVQRRGGGIVAIYNEPLILEALERFGYERAVARTFANDGCWEIIIPGQSTFGYHPFDLLWVLQQAMGLGPGGDELEGQVPDAADFESLYALFRRQLARWVESQHARLDGAHAGGGPSPLLALLVDDCIERARDYNDRGARYSVSAIHAGGLPDAANSLLAIRRLVYEQRRLSLAELLEILRTDWAGQEDLRRQVVRELTLYGNDDAEADAMVRRVYDDFTELVGQVRQRNGVLRPAGISTFGREIGWRDHRLATAFGRHRGEILATNLGPTPGSDAQGPTAVMKSFCSMDFRKLPNGVPLELKMMPATLKGPAGVEALVAIMRTFISLGGFFLHVDVVDSDLLRDAQAHPDRYPNLAVRISGWSARFATLNRDWQDMIIQRTQQRL